MISHNHYDALDIPTLERISKKWGSKIYVGLGNLPLLKENNINNVFEMDWWDRVRLNNIEISFVPVQHWSARGTGDKRETLWGDSLFMDPNKYFLLEILVMGQARFLK